jgi:hypothetical protein
MLFRADADVSSLQIQSYGRFAALAAPGLRFKIFKPQVDVRVVAFVLPEFYIWQD